MSNYRRTALCTAGSIYNNPYLQHVSEPAMKGYLSCSLDSLQCMGGGGGTRYVKVYSGGIYYFGEWQP